MPELTINTEQAMLAFGVKCARFIKAGQLVFLQGDLGAGKTTLAKGLLAGWGYKGVVSSPTFTLVEGYELPGFSVYHFDLYRLETSDELEMIGAREMFSAQSICLIEWPDKAADLLPAADVCFNITHRAQGRHIQLSGIGVSNFELQEKHD